MLLLLFSDTAWPTTQIRRNIDTAVMGVCMCLWKILIILSSKSSGPTVNSDTKNKQKQLVCLESKMKVHVSLQLSLWKRKIYTKNYAQ